MAEDTPIIDPSNVSPAAPTSAASVLAGDKTQVSSVPRRLRQPTADRLAPNQYNWGTGRRKASVARVRVKLGEGKFIINDKKDYKVFFPNVRDQKDAAAPLEVTNNLGRYDVFVNVQGGGTTGQAGAVLLGLARALVAADPSTFETLRDKGFLTRDSREVERKKYGFKKARKSFQFSKR